MTVLKCPLSVFEKCSSSGGLISVKRLGIRKQGVRLKEVSVKKELTVRQSHFLKKTAFRTGKFTDTFSGFRFAGHNDPNFPFTGRSRINYHMPRQLIFCLFV